MRRLFRCFDPTQSACVQEAFLMSTHPSSHSPVTHQHLPFHDLPPSCGSMVNQSVSLSLFIWMYLIKACSSCRQGQAKSLSQAVLQSELLLLNSRCTLKQPAAGLPVLYV